MDTSCEYAKFGCRTKLFNEDHTYAHIRDNVSAHLQLVCRAFESEVEKNKILSEKLDLISKLVKEHDKKLQAAPPQENYRDAGTPSSPVIRSAGISNGGGSYGSRDGASHASNGPSHDAKAVESSDQSSSMRRSTSGTFSGSIGSRRTSGSMSSPSPSPSPATASPNSTATDDDSKKTTSTTAVSGDNKRNSKRRSRTNASDEGLPEGFERGYLWEYDPTEDEWARGQIVFKMDQKPFAEGALRHAYRLEIISSVLPAESPPDNAILKDKTLKTSVPLELGRNGEQYVAKISKTSVPPERYFEDVKMQCICKELGDKFNKQGVPKKVDFIMVWVLEIQRAETILVGLEPYIGGEFVKFMTNDGLVLSERNTPPAFSHFTWEHSNHAMVVVDLQGVKDFYTDPQVHTKGGKDFGLGNLGMRGIERFLKTHKCNPVCLQLNLPSMNVDSSMTSRRRLLRGTMKAPSIEEDIDSLPSLPDIEAPSDLANGEFQCIQTLTGHDDRVICLVVNNNQLFSATADGTVKVWSLTGFSVVSTIRAHRKSVESMCFSDKYLFTASSDSAIKVWDLKDFALVERLKDHSGEVNVVCVSGDKLLSASFDKSIKVWTLSNLKCTHTLEGHTKSVKCLAAAGSVVFSGSNDGTIKVWSLTKMACIFSVDAHDQWVKALALRDYTLYSGAHDSLIKEWDLKNFSSLNTLSEHGDNITALLTTKRFLFSASEDKSVKIWAYNSQKSLATLKGHRSGVQGLCTDGKHLFSSSDDYTIKVWKWTKK